MGENNLSILIIRTMVKHILEGALLKYNSIDNQAWLVFNDNEIEIDFDAAHHFIFGVVMLKPHKKLYESEKSHWYQRNDDWKDSYEKLKVLEPKLFRKEKISKLLNEENN